MKYQKSTLSTLLIIILLISTFSETYGPVFAVASLTLSPTNGPVGTSVNGTGTGFTATPTGEQHHSNAVTNQGSWQTAVWTQKFTALPVGGSVTKVGLWVVDNGSGIRTQTQSNQASTSTGWQGSTWVEKFTILPSGEKITKVGINSVNNGSGFQTLTLNNQASTTTGWNTIVWLEKFTNIPIGGQISKVGLNVVATGSANVRMKCYQDDGNGGDPSTLLGESASTSVSGTGLQNFTLTTPATITASGNAWCGFETDNTNLNLKYTSGGATTRTVSHSYGFGPSPFGSASTSTTNAWMQITYYSSGANVRMKCYQDDGGGGDPSTLLGESASTSVSGTGLQNFTLTTPATIPASGNAWCGFETDDQVLNLKYTSGGATTRTVSHSYGFGPSPFGSASTSTTNAWMQVTYSGHSAVRVKVYQDDNGTGGPSTLLGESGSNIVSVNGMQNFTVSATIPASGNVWASYETNSSGLNLKDTNPQNGQLYVLHTYGSGPSPFGVSHELSASNWLQVTYSNVAIPITVKFDGSTVTTSSTDANGRFSQNFTVPNVTNGVHTVNASDTGGKFATASFNVTSVTSISISPTNGGVGATILVSGKGFTPSTAITIKFNSVIQTTNPVTFTTNSTGGFSNIAISPSDTTGGTYTVLATDGTIQATTTYTLYAGGASGGGPPIGTIGTCYNGGFYDPKTGTCVTGINSNCFGGVYNQATQTCVFGLLNIVINQTSIQSSTDNTATTIIPVTCYGANTFTVNSIDFGSNPLGIQTGQLPVTIPCNPIPTICPSGTTLQNGQCVGPLVCPIGRTSQNGQCVGPLVCPFESTLQGTQCILQPRCPIGTILQDGKCINNGIPIIIPPTPAVCDITNPLSCILPTQSTENAIVNGVTDDGKVVSVKTSITKIFNPELNNVSLVIILSVVSAAVTGVIYRHLIRHPHAKQSSRHGKDKAIKEYNRDIRKK